MADGDEREARRPGRTRLDGISQQQDDANVTPSSPALTFLGTFRRALYDPSILLQAEHAIGPKLAAGEMQFNKATRTQKGTIRFLKTSPRGWTGNQKQAAILRATEVRRWRWNIEPDTYRAFKEKIKEWKRQGNPSAKFAEFQNIVRSVHPMAYVCFSPFADVTYIIMLAISFLQGTQENPLA